MGFVFYDTETSGLSSAFDQILQFAAIRTDPELNEIERFEIRSRLGPSVIPHPKALDVTGTTVAQLTDKNLPSHYEMIREIREKMLEWSPAIIIGHNSIFFDEKFLRQSLYQTLHPPYLTNTSGNCRSDSLKIVQAVSVLVPNCISIPTDKSKQVFKLDQLAPANGFDHSNAHDALADVEATVFLCKLISERAPDLWSNVTRMSQKQAALDFIQSEDEFCLFEAFFGKPYAWIVTPIGPSPEGGSDFLVFDLFVDPEPMMAMTDDALAKRLSQQPKPMRSVRVNACPLVFPVDDTPEIAKALSIDQEERLRRANVLAENEEFRGRLISAFLSTRKPWESSPHVEEQIYDAFLTREDEQFSSVFHDLSWVDRYDHLDQISDERIKELGQRLIHAEKPDSLPKDIKTILDQENAQRMITGVPGEESPWLTIPEAISETDKLILEGENENKLLLDYRAYLEDRLVQETSIASN